MGVLSNKRRDMTEGVAWQMILSFSIPIMLGNLLQLLYNTVDGIVVGNYIDQNALSAVGNCATVSGLFIAIAIGISTGSGIIIAQLYGAGKEDDLKATAVTSMILIIGLGLVMSVVAIVFSDFILEKLLGITSVSVLEYSRGYLKIYCLGLVFTYGYNIISYALRALGDSAATLYFLAISSVINLILDLFLVRWWGVNGAAIATVIAQICCLAASIAYMLKKYPFFRFKRSELRVDLEKLKMCVKVGIPTMLQQCSVTLGRMLLQRLINHFGEFTMAACVVGLKIDNCLTIPIMGLQAGLSTFTGQNMGAGKTDRVKKAMKQTEIMGIIAALLIGVPLFLLAEQFVALFGVKEEALVQAVQYVRFTVPCMLMFVIYRISTGVLQGSGDVLFTTITSLSALALKLIFAYVMVFVFDAGYSIIWISVLVDYTWSMALAGGRYFSGKWVEKSKKIVAGH